MSGLRQHAIPVPGELQYPGYATVTESGNARSEQLNTRGTYRVANQPEFDLPEWIRTSKARLVFRYEISDFLR